MAHPEELYFGACPLTNPDHVVAIGRTAQEALAAAEGKEPKVPLFTRELTKLEFEEMKDYGAR
jgi:hypothetical protein